MDRSAQVTSGRLKAALLIGAAAISFAIAPAISTQFLADVFNHQAALGKPLIIIGDAKLYAPWAVFDWTPVWAETYPRPFAVARLIVFAGFLAGVLLAALATRRGFAPRPIGAGAWGQHKDAQAAGLFASTGTILGKLNGEVLAYDGPEHQILIGASRSGKGRGHVVPTLLAWPHSALVFDVKSELDRGDPRHGFPGTSGFRAKLGDVRRFAPTNPNSDSFNPLLEVRRGPNEVRDVQNIVEALVDWAGETKGSERFWNDTAKIVLTGVVLHVLYAEPEHRKTFTVVREKLRDLDKTAEEMRTTLHRQSESSGAPEVHSEVLHAAESYLAAEERLRSGIKATAESFFGVFADPLVAAKTATSSFRLSDLMCAARPMTLYLQPPPSDAKRLMPLMRLVLNLAMRTLTEDQTHDSEGRPKRHRLLFLIDEFPQLGRMHAFETALGACAGYGIKVSIICQSLNHVMQAYGRDNTILDNCHIVSAYGAADSETAKRIADMAGEVWEVRESESHKRPQPLLGWGEGSTTLREERRPLLLPGDVRALPSDEQLIFVSGSKPIRAKKLRFDQEAIFRARLLPLAPTAPVDPVPHDWTNVTALGRLSKEPKTAHRTARPSRAAPEQGELFAAGATISQRASAGIRRPTDMTPPAPPQASPPPPPPPRPTRRTGV